ncbi:hypothetical protein V3H18_01300 [Methylocystis sp. 9N]|uniref:Translation initiation factor IF-2 n=1 Tax=Methylocystis borbori TaxID=3118750 RepID=A0ABU7XCP6_9HYPH
MSSRARAFRGPLLAAAFMIAASGLAASAQEVQFDPKSLDDPGAATASPKAKGKKARAPQGSVQGAGPQQQGGRTPDRQFGELEGWSPGKAPPPKPGEKETTPSSGSAKGSMPIGVSPSGNMSVGLPF